MRNLIEKIETSMANSSSMAEGGEEIRLTPLINEAERMADRMISLAVWVEKTIRKIEIPPQEEKFLKDRAAAIREGAAAASNAAAHLKMMSRREAGE
jgi:hypothetical protein